RESRSGAIEKARVQERVAQVSPKSARVQEKVAQVMTKSAWVQESRSGTIEKRSGPRESRSGTTENCPYPHKSHSNPCHSSKFKTEYLKKNNKKVCEKMWRKCDKTRFRNGCAYISL
ncbi:hypothetical protein, partial [Lysinibacillus sp. UBA6686]